MKINVLSDLFSDFVKILKLPSISLEDYKQLLTPGILLWLLMAGLALGRAANDTFFIGESGAEQLPRVYMFNAVVLAIVAIFYSFLGKRMQRFSFLIWIIVASIIILIYLRSQFGKGHSWLPFAIFCYYEVLLLLVQMHFWTCLNDVFGPREGKRLFPYIGAIGLAGTIFGGLFTWIASPFIGFHNLFYVWIFLLVCVVPVGIWMKHSFRITHNYVNQRQKQDQKLKIIWKVPLVRYMALLSIPLWLVVHSVDWLFYLAVEEIYMDRPNELSSFLGLLSGMVSFVGILLQAFVSSHVLRKFGVSFSYSLYSISMTFCASLFVVRGFLPIAPNAIMQQIRSLVPVVVRLFDESVFFSMYDSALQLLYGALPTSMRGQARATIYGILETLMTAISGAILSLVVIYSLPHYLVAWFAFVLGIIWIILSLGIKKHYLNALAMNLNMNFNIDRQEMQEVVQNKSILRQFWGSKLDNNTRDMLLKSAYSKDANVALVSLNYIKNLRDKGILVQLAKDINKLSGVVFEMGLHLLSENNVVEALPTLKRIYTSKDVTKQASILKCIGYLEPKFLDNNFDFLMNSPQPGIRAVAITSLIEIQKRLDVQSLAFQGLKKMVRSRDVALQIESAKIIGQLRHSNLSDLLLELASKKNHELQLEVIKSMSSLKNKNIAEFLVNELISKEQKEAEGTYFLRDALVQQNMIALPALHKKLNAFRKDLAPSNILVLESLLYCLGEIGSVKSIASITSLLRVNKTSTNEACITALAKISYQCWIDKHKSDSEIFNKSLRKQIQKYLYKNIEYIRRIQRYENSVLLIKELYLQKLLKDALARNLSHCQELVLKCLSILYDPIKVFAVTQAIKSKETRSYAEGLEILEGLGSEGLAFSHVLEGHKASMILALNKPHKFLTELIKTDYYPWLTVCAIYAIKELGLDTLLPFVRNYAKHPNRLVCASSIQCIDKLKLLQKKTKKTKKKTKLSKKKKKKVQKKRGNKMATIDMEKILFLRSVPIFTDVDVNDIQWISEIVRTRKLNKDEYVFHEDDSANSFYIVQEGEVHICKGKITLDILQSRDHFGEIALFDQQPRTASALAVEDTKLLAINRNDFHRLILARPRISLSMFNTISRRVRELTKRVSG